MKTGSFPRQKGGAFIILLYDLRMKKYIYFYLLIFSITMVSCNKESKNYPGEKEMEKKVENLLSQMTLEEKIGQMNQISFWGDNIEPFVSEVKEGKVGSLLNISDPALLNRLQKIAVEESRLGIPLLIGRDVIHGFKTIFPIPLGQAATFDPEIVEEGAAIAAAEARSTGIHWTFAPMLDISRDSRWGRIAESLGEDTYLASVLGAAMVRGFQGNKLSDETSIAACVKHFFGYGAAEGGRDYNSTYIPLHQMRNVYLPPFEAAVKAGAVTAMSSFNDNDGIPASANRFLLTDVLRKEWKFNGFVVSDWASIAEMISHGFSTDLKEAAMQSANAGLDMDMMSFAYTQNLAQLAGEGKVKQSTIDNAVRNILRIKFRLGLFDNPYTSGEPSFYKESSLQKAQKAAEESIVLLKNENNTLPLKKGIKTLVIAGAMADAPHDQLGTWIFDGEKARTITPVTAIRDLYGKEVNVIFEKGLNFSRDLDQSQFPKALKAAKEADAIIAIVGEEAILSGEAHSLADISLKGAQKELIRELKKAGKPLVVIVIAGRALTIEDELDASDALLYSFHPGTMGGAAIANLLFGKAVPSGKLPVTFPKHVGQIPIYYNHNSTGRPSNKTETLLYDIPLEAGQTSLGNTSYYLDAGFDPLFPFGYGLSYTTFEYSDIRLNKNTLLTNDNLEVTVTLKNSGDYDATEVVQLYVRDLAGSLTRPVKELKSFRRVPLKAGESKEVTLSISTDDLAFYGIDGIKKAEPGAFKVWVGGSSEATLEADFSIE